MKNSGQTLAYLFKYGKGKRFLLMSLVLCLPCAIVAYFFPLSDYITMLFNFSTLSFPNWGALWLASFNTNYKAWISLAVALLVFIPIFAYVTTIIVRHIRTGKFGFPNLFKSVNDNFFAGLSVVLFYILTVAVFHLIYTLLFFMWLQLSNKILGLILTILSFLIVLIGVTYVLSATMLWLPIMSFTGQYVLPALGSAFYKSRNYQRYFFVPSLVVVSAAFLIALGCHFLRDIWYVKWILTTITYTAVLVLFITFSLISYCEAESIQREDLKKIYFGR